MSRKKTNLKLVPSNVELEASRRRKSWSLHDLKSSVRPLTDNQRDMFEAYISGQHICAHGSAGTGKTFISLYLALNELLTPKTKKEKIVIVRSIVEGRKIGALPGELHEKTEPYERPYKDIIGDLMGRFSTYDDMVEAGLLEFQTTSFLRGLTWDNTIVVIDEVQNCTFWEINSVLTRLGTNSRIIVCGDTLQTDLHYSTKDTSGMEDMLRVFSYMPNMNVITFNKFDIVRSAFVKEWITACEDALGKKG